MKVSSSPGAAARRWTSAAAVLGAVSAVLVSPFALGTASAAAAPTVTNVTITSTTNAPAGGTATITGTYTPAAGAGGTAPSIEYTIQGGSADTATFPAGTPCTVQTDGTFTCSVHNGGTAGTDNVRVFADNNGNNTYDTVPTPEPSAVTSVDFSSAPATIHFTTAPTTSATDTCQVYTAHVTDANGNPATGQTVDLTVTETATSTPSANPITLYPADCTGTGTSGGTVTGNTITYTHTFTVDNSGNVSFGLASSAPGTATVRLSNPANTVSDQATTTFTQGGANSVTTLTVTPPTTKTGFTGGTLTYTVRATDSAGNPVQGVTVMEQTTSGPDTLAPTACGTTNSNGTVTCSITNGGTAGTDQLTFWVNNTNGTPRTNGPDNGEPQATATAVFNSQPAVSSANSSLTCQQQLAGSNQGSQQTDCTVPTTQHSVTFTATVRDANGNPIANQPVTFTATSATLGGVPVTGSNLPSGTGTTNSSGVATFTVNDPNAQNGDNVTVQASVGSQSVGTATAHWANAAATTLVLTPQLQTVTKGGTVTVHAQVVDQFGNPLATQPAITYVVTGRNNGVSGTTTNGTITYTDTGINPSATTDTISAHDVADGLNGTAGVNYVTGSATPSTVTVDTSGNGTSDATCGTSGNTGATGVTFNHVTPVCAIVKNASGEPLAGQSVTFTVSNGQVGAPSTPSSQFPRSTDTKTYTTTTDAAGVAFAAVTSTTSGVQTVTATAGSATGSGTITYVAPQPTDAYSIAMSPPTITVNPGSQQKFTATVTDKFGNPVANVSVTFTQSGPGSLGGASSQTVTTGPDGTASVNLSTAATDTGSGSITATIATAGTQCASSTTATPPSKCSATSTYTVQSTVTPQSLALSPQSGVVAGGREHVTATVTNSNGTRAAGQVVRFFVSGANTASGSAVTNSSGNATFSYAAAHAGTDNIAAYVDTNNDQIREANEPRQFTTAHIGSVAKRAEHPTLRVRSAPIDKRFGAVTFRFRSHPSVAHALVVFYMKNRFGKWARIASSHTNIAGHAGRTVTVSAGRHSFKARIHATSTTRAANTSVHTITVHHT